MTPVSKRSSVPDLTTQELVERVRSSLDFLYHWTSRGGRSQHWDEGCAALLELQRRAEQIPHEWPLPASCETHPIRDWGDDK